MPVMVPLVSAWNLTPSSTACVSLPDPVVGVTEFGHIVHGQTAGTGVFVGVAVGCGLPGVAGGVAVGVAPDPPVHVYSYTWWLKLAPYSRSTPSFRPEPKCMPYMYPDPPPRVSIVQLPPLYVTS